MEEGAAAGVLAQALSGCCWPAPRVAGGSARLASAGHQGETSLAWFPGARHSQGQHTVTSWDLGVVVLRPQGAVSISHSLLSCLDRAWPAVTAPFYYEMVPREDGSGPGTGFGHRVQAVNDIPTFTFDGPRKGLQSYFLTC